MDAITGTFQIVNRGASYNAGKVTQESVAIAAVKPEGDVQVHGNLQLVVLSGRGHLPDGLYRITVEPIGDPIDEAPATPQPAPVPTE